MEGQNSPQIQPEPQPIQKKDAFRKLLPIAIGAGFLIVVVGVFLMFRKDDSKQQISDVPTQQAHSNIPDNLGPYQNTTLGIKFLYPKEYIKLTDEMYPVPLVTLASSPNCIDLSWATGEQFGDCFVLNVWQQPKPYNFNLSSTNFYRNESLQLNDALGTIKTYERFGTEIVTIQIPRYSQNDASKATGELIIQYSYRRENSERANEVLRTLLDNLEVNQTYALISPPSCCKQETPTVLVRNAGKLRIFQKNVLTEIPIALEDSVGGEKISSDGNKVAFLHWNYERDRVGLFSSAKTGVAVVEAISPHKITRLIAPGINAHTYLSWSPDGRYLSYVLDDGQGVGMLDIQKQQEVFRFLAEDSKYDPEESGGRPLVWVDDKEFSFIYNGKLYLGTLTNPTSKVIADGATNAESRFESTPALYEPLWSPDGKYVMYRTKESAIIQNINTNKKYQLGKQVESEFGFYLNISEIGWTKNNEFLFEEDNQFKLARIELSGLSIQNIAELSGNDISYSLIGSGPYVAVYSGYLTSPLTIYDINQKIKVCQNLHMGKYYAAYVSKTNQNVYVVANPLVPEWVQWPNNSYEATDQAKKVLEVFNITSCESLGGFIVDDSTSGVNPNVQMIPD